MRASIGRGAHLRNCVMRSPGRRVGPQVVVLPANVVEAN